MNSYGSSFFAGGGVPPLGIGGSDARLARGHQAGAQRHWRAIDDAAQGNWQAPDRPASAGYELKPIGFDPDKGQMTDGRRFQVEEIARIYNLPPVFLQDLTNGTFSNTEQQDLFFVKHLVGQWAQNLEQE
jgi:phage portal protein BeeE